KQRSEACGAKHATAGHRRTHDPRALEDAENDSRDPGNGSVFGQCCARSLEEMTVGNTRRAHGLAGAATEATSDVRLHAGIARLERPLEHRPHEQDAPARAVVLVLERQIRRTGRQTEAAVHAGIDAAALFGKWTVRQRAGWCGMRCAHAGAPSTPGFRMAWGSKLDRIRAESVSPGEAIESTGHSSRPKRSPIRVVAVGAA